MLLNYMVTRIEDPDALRKGYLDLMQAGAPPVVSMPVQAILALLCGVETLPP